MKIRPVRVLSMVAMLAVVAMGQGFPRWQIAAPSPTADAFGSSVAIVGDQDGDGLRDVLVGARSHQSPLAPSAFTYALTLSSVDGSIIGAWFGTPTAQFGAAVADAGDLDVDGISDIIIGAPGPGGSNSVGSVYVYSGATGASLHTFPEHRQATNSAPPSPEAPTTISMARPTSWSEHPSRLRAARSVCTRDSAAPSCGRPAGSIPSWAPRSRTRETSTATDTPTSLRELPAPPRRSTRLREPRTSFRARPAESSARCRAPFLRDCSVTPSPASGMSTATRFRTSRSARRISPHRPAPSTREPSKSGRV